MNQENSSIDSSPIDFGFDTPVNRVGTYSEKWAMYEERGILPLWLADMDFRSPPQVIEALQRRVEHGVFGYTRAPHEFVSIVLAMLESEYGWSVQSDWLVWLPGLVTGLNVACRAFGEPGDDVLTAVPVYPPFLTAPRRADRNLITVPLMRTDNRWCFDFDRLRDAVTPKTRLLLLCNPHNPVGRVLNRDELAAIAAFCNDHNLMICSDEIHCGLILDKERKHIPMATLGEETARRTVTLMAPSKTYNLPGLGCSFAIISDPEARSAFRKAMAGIVPYVNALGFSAALSAYRDCGEWLAALLDYLRGNRETVYRAVNDMPGLSMTHVEATYLAWIDTREAGLENPVGFFEERGVGLGNGKPFGGPGFLRLTFGCPRSTLVQALNLMEQALMTRARSEK